MRVLVVHTRLHERDTEAYEVYETVAGLVAAAREHGSEVDATDGRRLYATELVDGELEYRAVGSLGRALARRYDVAHVHMVLPQVHLLLALLLRLRGVPVVLTPMSMLGDDFARGSWFRDPTWVMRLGKPWAVRLMRLAWSRVAVAHVVASAEEARLAHLPSDRCSLLPLPAPRTPLADAVLAAPPAGGSAGPLAFVSRLDPHRKGLDRLARWLLACAADLPRPAAVLYAPDDGRPRPPELDRAERDGLLRWDRTSRGAELVAELAAARAVVLLSRWDGQPRVLREAALLGLPTVSTPASHFTEVVEVLRCGVLVLHPDDPADVQRAFEAAVGGRRDAAAARRLFDRVEVGRSLLQVLRRVAAGERRVAVDHYRRLAPALQR